MFECLDVPIAVMDYVNTGRISFFQITILIIYFYALTFGNQNIQKLDMYIKRKIMILKGKSLSIEDKRIPPNKDYAKSIKQGFLMHISVFLLIHILLVIEFTSPLLSTHIISDLFNSETGDIFHNKAINRTSIMWSLFLMINGFVALLYTYSPLGFYKNK
ncbi:hypothetical protein KHA93_00730 [Bacillus sp. FJAT-49732]|uniref:Uncharacterized protein n=1 Tax=Lederbergia citrisecunda TaxID=2833583 RepID=A0A942YIC5_9BACI|nr:hypothetical protein [Lederbergia citrisecunda]MBS4198183.1 hypothetical protein [Lederbergia citrisecunda]